MGACTAPAEPEADNNSGEEVVTVKIGATSVPHAEVLSFIKPELEQEGIELDIQEFSDWTQLNPSLAGKELDANYFQHVPYLETYNEGAGTDLVPIAKVHVEPLGVYSKKIASINDIPEKAVVAIPNDATNCGRALLLLQKAGLLTLKEGVGLTATPLDIAANPKQLQINELEAASLPRTLDEVDFAVINTNYALPAGLNPKADAIFIEDKDSPYANVLVVRAEDKDSAALKKVAQALNNEAVKKFIEEKYEGAVVPAF
ncbi:MAG: MetQ/NlpA family ABC transporter substrate-binding protein [bacterium]